MPSYVSGAEVIAEDRIAGGLYFFVLARMRLTLDEDGSASLSREVVVDSWFEPHTEDVLDAWSGTHDRGVVRWTNPRRGAAVASVRCTSDDEWLVITDWEGDGAPHLRAFQRAVAGPTGG